MNILSILAQTTDQLQSHFDEREANYIAKLLLGHYMQLSNTDLLVRNLEEVSQAIVLKMEKAVMRLQANEPVQYIIGTEFFYGFEFLVSPDVLIPRPETEELVAWVLENVDNMKRHRVIDLGTGSGCIAISLDLLKPNLEVMAMEFSETAFSIAQKNRSRLKASVELIHASILDEDSWNSLPKLDIIVSNPPYIPDSESHLMKANVKDYEPGVALFVRDNDPLLFYRTIAEQGNRKLNNAGWIYFECNEFNVHDVAALLKDTKYVQVEVKADMQGKERMVRAQKGVNA